MVVIKNNALLIELGKTDQSDRALLHLKKITFEKLKENDAERLMLVEKEIEQGRLNTAQDYRNAGLVFHHSRIKLPYSKSMAVKCLRKSAELDNYKSHSITWLLAATIDRELQSKNEKQIYGTQHIKNDAGKDFGVLTIAEQLKEVDRMNQKQLTEFYAEHDDVGAVLNFCERNWNADTEYDLSWKAISQFGFYLHRLGKLNDALRVLETAVKIYPEEYDLYHSLGFLHGEKGDDKKAIEFTQKSIELNPGFKEGIKDLERLKQKHT